VVPAGRNSRGKFRVLEYRGLIICAGASRLSLVDTIRAIRYEMTTEQLGGPPPD
jgi:hypothetical protein